MRKLIISSESLIKTTYKLIYRHSVTPERCDFKSSQQYNNDVATLIIIHHVLDQNLKYFNKFI